MKFKYLCIVIDKATQKELYSQEVEANNEFFARHKAGLIYKELEPDSPYEWFVDSMKLD